MREHRTRHNLLRTRWSAIGAAVAVTLGAGGLSMAQAAIDTGDRPVTVTITAERILDTRTNLGLAGRFADATPRDLQVTGSVPVASGGSTTVVPNDAIGVLVNVTVVTPTHEGFLSLRPQGATGEPTTSTVNFVPGAIEPNAATVDLNNGEIQIWVETASNSGSADVLIDVVGYTIGHTHDDRYYTETEADAVHATKADSADVYTRAQVDNRTSRVASSSVGGFPRLSDGDTLTTVTITVPTKQYVHLSADAAIFTNDTQAATCSSVNFCNIGIEIFDADTNTRLTPLNGAFFRLRDTNDGQGLAISVVVPASAGTHTYRLQTRFASVIADIPYLNNATLTAMSVPFGGTGSAPTATSAAQAAPSGANAATG